MYTKSLITAINMYSTAFLKVRQIESGETKHASDFARELAIKKHKL